MNTKNLKLFFKILLIVIAFGFIACKKDKTENAEAPVTEQPTNSYPYSELYIDRVAFNSAGHLVTIFSKEISKNQNLNELITLSPEVPNFEIEAYGNKIVLKGNFEKEVPYSLTYAENLIDVDGIELKNSYPFTNLYVGKLKPSLSFSDSASTLPSFNNKRINFTSTNVKKVKVEVVKIYMNNITDYLKSKDYGYYKETFKQDLGDVVFSKEYVLDNKTDEVIRNSIDLNGVIDSKGVYYVNILVNNPDDIDYDENKYGYIDYYEWIDNSRVYARAEKNIILSDLGLIANSNANKLEVKAINLNTLEAMPNTKLEFISKKNQVLEEGYTVSNGEYKSKLNPDDVLYILAKNNNEFNVLYLNDSLINYSDFDIGGLVESSDLKVFTYTDKGYYRPGDEIAVSLIARNKDKVLEEKHPFSYSFISPNGREKFNNITVNESKNGFYNFNIKTDINDETGAWNLKIKFGGKEVNQPIFIEAKAPNRIAIDIDTSKTYTKADLAEGDILYVEVLGTYLTGVKANGSQTNYNISLFEKDVQTKKFKNYTFINPTSNFMYNSYIDGTLDGNGKEKIAVFIPEVAKKFNLDIFITANILDTNGRYSMENKKLTLVNNDFYIGLQKSSEENGNATVNFIVLDEKTDNLIEGKNLKYKVFNKKYNWWYDSYEDDESRIKNAFDTIVIQEGTLTSSSTPQAIKLNNLEDGINFLEVEDPETGVSSGIFIYNYSYGDKAKNGMENLNISSDKEKYEIGDIAKIKFNGTEGAKALITIEKDGKILKEYWKDLSQKNTEEAIQIEKDFFPNVYVNVSVFQKYKDKENDRPLRLYGTVPLMVNDKEKALNVVIDSKSEAEPSTNYKLKIYNNEKQKMYFQYFLVDEGVLRLTDYKLPKPFEYFYGKQAKLVKNYDNFSDVIEKYSNNKITNYLKTGGGDFEEAALAKAAFMEENLNLQGNAERFKNISIVSDILETDENGYAEVDIKIPNYFGAMKIFVVATNNEKFGSTEKKLTIKAPVIVESSAPRVLKVGDKFAIPVTLFPIEDNLGSGKLTIKYEGKEFTKEVNFTNKENQKFSFDLVAPEVVGETKIEVSYTSAKYNFKDTIDINVDSPYPQQYLSQNTVLKAGQEFKINASDFKDFIKSSLNSELKLSSYENLGLNKVITSLLDYPYICLEQTTSKGKAMLAINHLTNDINELNTAKNTVNTIIKKLFNNYQLSNGSFAYWPGNNYEYVFYSIYATEFVVEAKLQGYYVPDQMYEQAMNYIKSLLNRTDINIESKIDILFILAKTGQPNVSEMNIIFDRHYKNLPVISKWTLLDAYNLIGESTFAKNEADKLPRKTDIKGIYTVYEDAEILKHYHSIYKEREKALFDNLLSIVKADTWLQTYAQANIVEALAKNIDDTERKDLSFTITTDNATKEYTLKNGQFNFEEINNDLKASKKIIVKNTSNDNLYVNFLVKGKPIKYNEKDESKNITITRSFIDMDGKDIDPKKLKVGDKFTMVIETEQKASDYLENIALIQILPSGWEIESVDSASYEVTDYVFDYIDKRDDRVAFFYGQGKDELKDIRININVVSPGEYYLPGTSVAAMYDNNFRAYLKGFEVKVSDK